MESGLYVSCRIQENSTVKYNIMRKKTNPDCSTFFTKCLDPQRVAVGKGEWGVGVGWVC